MYTYNRIAESLHPSVALPNDWVIFSQIWFETCRHFGLPISHHALAVAMHKADGGARPWAAYLTCAEVECQRQWDLEDPRIRGAKQLHEQRGVVFLPIDMGWEIRVFDTYVWQWQSIKAWLTEHDAHTAWFYEVRPVGTRHLLPAQRQAERLVGIS